MLTPALVRARRKNGELEILPLGKRRDRAEELAAAYLGLAREHVSKTRAELEEAASEIPVVPAERKLALGLAKLVEDACEFSAQSEAEPPALRSELFLLASERWRGLEPGARFDRDQVVRELGARRALEPETVDALLYADLRSAQIVRSAPRFSPAALVERWERAQAQAVLLRAERVVADVRCRQPAAYRTLFAKLKFRRLLHRIQRLPDGGYRIEIDGPYSLFESVTKYGLELALILPALEECDELRLIADVRWGKTREPLRFKLEGRGSGASEQPAGLPDEVSALIEAFAALDSDWQARPASEVLDFPGIGLCVPDLEFRHRPSGARVLFEVLGFWSRDAVWRRIELAERGLPEPMLFAVSSRLRVSSELLDGVESAALYVYKGTMSARAIERQLERLLSSRSAIVLEKAGSRR